MASFKRSYTVRHGLSLDNKTGILYGIDNPSEIDINSEVDPEETIPESLIYIRLSPPQIWQKTGPNPLDFTLISSGVQLVPQLYLPFILSNETEIQLPLTINTQLPLLLSNGSEVALSVGLN